jgi:predicted nucleotidyltransferase
MPSAAQVENWSKQPDSARAKVTHEAIREALRSQRSVIKDRDFDDFLQGSYRNDTNIRGDSDVDIVVRLNTTFSHDTSRLAPFWAAQMQSAYPVASYQFADFRRDVFATLSVAFGSSVRQENKCIRVPGRNGRLDADVVPCLEHRNYRQFTAVDEEQYDRGIAFYTLREGRTGLLAAAGG